MEIFSMEYLPVVSISVGLKNESLSVIVSVSVRLYVDSKKDRP